MPITAIPNVGSQLDRAIVAYLISVEAGTADDTFPANGTGDKELPNTIVRSTGSTHAPMEGGNEQWTVSIMVRASAVDPETGEPSESARVALDNRVGLVLAAMLQSEDGQTLNFTADAITTAGRALAVSDPTNNADMDQFTCQAVYYNGAQRGNPDGEDAVWVEMRNFTIHCCPTALS
jgi:hypothetical protein